MWLSPRRPAFVLAGILSLAGVLHVGKPAGWLAMLAAVASAANIVATRGYGGRLWPRTLKSIWTVTESPNLGESGAVGSAMYMGQSVRCGGR